MRRDTFGAVFTWIIIVSSALQLVLSVIGWDDPWAFSHRMMWNWHGETPSMTFLWSLGLIITGVAAAIRRRMGFHALIAALLLRFGCDVAASGFRQMQVAWLVMAAALLANRFATPSEKEMVADETSVRSDSSYATERMSFRWTAQWRNRFLMLGLVAVGGPLLVIAPLIRTGMFPAWWLFVFPGAFIVVFGAVFMNSYPIRVEFSEGQTMIIYLLGYAHILTLSEVESIDLEHEISPAFPKGIAIILPSGRKLTIPPFFEDFGELKAHLQRLTAG